MKKNTLPTLLATVALVLAFGLMFTGCGLNRTDAQTTADTAPVIDQEQLIETRLAELQAEQARLEQFAEELDAREAEAALAAPAPAPIPKPRTVALTLPMLTALEIDLDGTLSSESSLAGDAIRGIVAQDVLVDGLVAIAAGSEIQGFVTEAVPSRKFGGQARLQLAFDRLIGTDGIEAPIAATLELTGKRQRKKDAGTIAASAGGGALLGRILKDSDRDEGTAIGAVVGGAIGAVVAARNNNDPVELTTGTPLTVQLDAPLTVEVSLDV